MFFSIAIFGDLHENRNVFEGKGIYPDKSKSDKN